MEKLKIFVLGIIVYLSKNMFFKIGGLWFEELKDKKRFECRVDTLRESFWQSLLLVILVTSTFSAYLVLTNKLTINDQYILRVIAIIIALTASLGRGGWNIQSNKGKTIIERIDRGMFVLSQFGATLILLFALTMH